ncbi:protein ADM2a [Tachysurus fulvidraco]|uniref:protein ADM2a n=1 Tax=Tachysurus fulvidraco TaxID=1234273 RepID=UPI000F4EB1B9|nr:protein ADM2a [Tachysurus fulvidraco]
MRSLLPLILYCISLLCLQLDALPVGNRLDFKAILRQQRDGRAVFPDTDPSSDDPILLAPAGSLDRTSLWRALLYKNPLPSSQESKSALNPTGNFVESNQRNPRGRRSIHTRGHHHQHGQLMRVGCVLGTCQIQKLSQRLYELVGQAGREDSAPINPHSPHSYG